MERTEQPEMPIWMEAKSKKQLDVIREASKVLEQADRTRANKPITDMMETDLESEQFRLEDLLHRRAITVADFRRLREIDWHLDAMRERREYGSARDEWKPESLNE